MKKLFSLIFTGFLIAVASPALGAEYYIDAAIGSDSAAGSEAAPWQTLAMIADANINGGDTVYLKGDFAATTLTLDSTIEGTLSGITTIKNWEGETPSIALTESAKTFTITGDYYEINGIEFHNNGALSAFSTAIYINGGLGVNITRCKINDAYRAIWVSGSSEEITVQNNFIYNNTNGFLNSANTNYFVYNNTFNNNSYDAYVMDGTGNIRNNIFANNTGNYVFAYSSIKTITFDYNLFYNNTAIGYQSDTTDVFTALADWQAEGNGTNSLSADPSFVSTTSGSEDFHITDDSVCIDAGEAINSVVMDYDLESRPYAVNFDIGADERPVVSAATSPSSSSVTETTATLSWTAPSTTVSTYTLLYDTNEDFSAATEVDSIAAVTTDLTGLTANTVYYYKIKSIYTSTYTSYESAYTTAASFTTSAVDGGEDDQGPESPDEGEENDQDEELEEDYTPVKVENVKVPKKTKKAKQAKIKWTKQEDATGYILQLQKYKTKTKKYKKIKTIKLNTNKAYKLIKKLKANTKYRIKIRAKRLVDDTTYKGTWSKYIKFKTKK